MATIYVWNVDFNMRLNRPNSVCPGTNNLGAQLFWIPTSADSHYKFILLSPVEKRRNLTLRVYYWFIDFIGFWVDRKAETIKYSTISRGFAVKRFGVYFVSLALSIVNYFWMHPIAPSSHLLFQEILLQVLLLQRSDLVILFWRNDNDVK